MADLPAVRGGSDHPGMVAIGSADWLAALARALEGAGGAALAPDLPFTLQRVVTGGADGDVAFWTIFSGDGVEVHPGRTPDPDLTLTHDRDTAAEMARGDLLPQAAFMQGRMKVEGDMSKLLRNPDAVAAVCGVGLSLPAD